MAVDVKAVADSVRVPLNCLEGIWSKAAELLNTPDAIVPAPGVGPGAKFVLSYSGKRPHLVVPKKGGAVACDQDCPNWKSLGICAHSVAVANHCSKLPEFIAWFRKAKKSPNITSFADATMPKGRGNKGTKCPRKRKAPVATETVLENPILCQDLKDDSFTPGSSSFSIPPTTTAVSQINYLLQ